MPLIAACARTALPSRNEFPLRRKFQDQVRRRRDAVNVAVPIDGHMTAVVERMGRKTAEPRPHLAGRRQLQDLIAAPINDENVSLLVERDAIRTVVAPGYGSEHAPFREQASSR